MGVPSEKLSRGLATAIRDLGDLVETCEQAGEARNYEAVRIRAAINLLALAQSRVEGRSALADRPNAS